MVERKTKPNSISILSEQSKLKVPIIHLVINQPTINTGQKLIDQIKVAEKDIKDTTLLVTTQKKGCVSSANTD